MSLQNLLSQFASGLGPDNNASPRDAESNPLSSLASSFPGGLAGGAAAGGVMALLMGSKSSRKMLGKFARIGGTALVGGLAYKAYSNWQQNKPLSDAQPVNEGDIQQAQAVISTQTSSGQPLHLTLVKAMVSAAKADGHLDAQEHQNISEAVQKLELGAEDKAAVFDAMARDIPVEELAGAVTDDTQKAEVYLAAYLAIELDVPKEREYLDSLATALALPEGLPAYLEEQAQQGFQ